MSQYFTKIPKSDKKQVPLRPVKIRNDPLYAHLNSAKFI